MGKGKIRDFLIERKKENLPPPAETPAEATPKPEETKEKPPEPAPPKSPPPKINLSVPFTSQAPYAVWDHKDEEACEEAALLMVHRFHQKRKIEGKEDARKAIDELIEGEKKVLGGVWESTTAEEIAKVAREFLGHSEVQVKYDPTIEDIKKAVADGHPVIVPAAGRMLKNPYYKQPGPLYHGLVIKGYTEKEFITNDPGTRRGADYTYPYERVMDAIHDWNGGDVNNGRKVMIVIKP